MQLDQKLVDAAIALMDKRYPDQEGGAAAMYTDKGTLLTSVGIEGHLNDAANLCHETGALLEAGKLGEKVVASVCVYREERGAPTLILAPCGICQERLIVFGDDVEVAVPREDDPTQWESKQLREVQPYYWGKVFKEKG